MRRKEVLKKAIAKCLLVVFGFILAFALAESGARAYLYFHPMARYMGRWEFRATCPRPYKNASYFNKDFLDESLRCVTGITNPPETSFIVQGDFRGKYFNVESGKRKTFYQPLMCENRILLFGGSTMFCQEVPDQYTIASYLQNLLNIKVSQRFRVESYGTVSMIAAQQTARLLRTPIQHGDIVVFYDGVNDVFYPIYNGNPKGWLPGGSHDGGVRQLNWLQRRLYPLALKYSDCSSIAALFLKRLECKPPTSTADQNLFKRNLETAEQGYKNALIGANHYVTENGGCFYHFFQPNLLTLRERSAYEQWLLDNELKQFPGLDEAFGAGYLCLQEAIKFAQGEGVHSFNLTDAFDERSPGEEFYLDCFHCNHVGNERIACLICEVLFPDSVSGEK